jgi:(2Fe-2S) ferredoxin
MIVYPEGVAYSYRSDEDIEEILRKHLILGRRVEHLVLRIDPGKLH